MKVKHPVQGGICESLQGRDKGNLYCICGILGDGYVLVADGKAKPLGSPKRKNVRHLRLYPDNASEGGVDFSRGRVSDSQIAYALKTFAQNSKNKSEE